MAAPPALPATTASLYVGDLHPDITDGQLFGAFSEFQSLASVRVCCDSSTGKSLCYGYVNFVVPQDAMRAIELKNNTRLNGKVIRVSWSHRDPDARKNGIGIIFVKNLSDSVGNAALQDIFAKFGNILSCKVVTSEDGKSKGYGYVQYDSDESANAAIEKLNDTIVDGKRIYVAKFVKKSERVMSDQDAKYTNLYMKNLDLDVSEELLREYFSKYGKILSLVISKDDNGVSKGFGFVNFENPDEAKQAVEALNGLQLGSKVMYVARAQKKAEREQMLRQQFEEKRREQFMKFNGSNVYVKNIDDNVTDDELRDHFSQCGTITSAKLMRDDKGISKGFGFICFSTPDEANKAVAMFHGHMFHRKPLYVGMAQRKEDRQAQLQLHNAQRMAGLTGPSPAVIPGGYPPFYYTAPPPIIPQVSPQSGLMYQPFGLRPGWSPSGFCPQARTACLPSPVPMISSNGRQYRPNRGKTNGHLPSHVGGNSASAHSPQPSQSVTSSNDSNSPQRAGQLKYAPNGRGNRGTGVSSSASNSAGNELHVDGQDMLSLSSMLAAAASPEQQKQVIGERLYPLIQKLKPDLAAKITGMLLEMDHSELLLLLESPDSLSTKVEEAVQVLKRSKAKLPNSSSHNALHTKLMSAEVAVN